jgi:hypothetical protein
MTIAQDLAVQPLETRHPSWRKRCRDLSNDSIPKNFHMIFLLGDHRASAQAVNLRHE